MQQLRVQKLLSENGILSRRKAEQAIMEKRVTVNGRPCELGHKVNLQKDIVAIDGVSLRLGRQKQRIYIILNKPRGYLTTTQDERGRRCVLDLVRDVPDRIYPVGRLDKDSEGLLLLTNDGAFANEIMHPSGHVPRTYRVTVRPAITEEQVIRLSTGVKIEGDDRPTLPAAVHVQSREPNRAVLQITVREGRNRQIRRMCEAVGLSVARLRRISVGPVKLGMLQPGKWRELKPSELSALRGSVSRAKNNREE